MKHIPHGPYEKYIKRPLDCILATGALVVLSPVLGVTALATRKKLGSPIIFLQERPGRIDPKTGEEKIFKLYKFRTMTDEKDEEGNLLPDEARLTKFGQFLRSTSLDELPELINIIKGDMSIIGPRPLLVRYLPFYTEREHKRHSVRPGLTGLSQINGRNSLPWDERLELDVKYAENISFIKDLRIFFKTIGKVARHEDVVDAGNFDMKDLDEERSDN